jgi:polyisoprenoid-binding protein YceI
VSGMTESSTQVEKATETVGFTYLIDGRASRFAVRAFASGMLAVMGHNPTVGIREFSGEMSFDPEKIEAGSFRFVVKADSLSVQDDVSDKDRREMERLMNHLTLP